MAHMTTIPTVASTPPATRCYGCGREPWRILFASGVVFQGTCLPLCRACACDAMVALAAALRREQE